MHIRYSLFLFFKIARGELMINRLEEYKARLEMYYQAEEAILNGAQSYSLGSRNLTRANLSEVRQMIDY